MEQLTIFDVMDETKNKLYEVLEKNGLDYKIHKYYLYSDYQGAVQYYYISTTDNTIRVFLPIPRKRRIIQNIPIEHWIDWDSAEIRVKTDYSFFSSFSSKNAYITINKKPISCM
ncbi:hypothetical protein ACQCWD_27150 [Bacillus thuringiensis]|uniref:Uncharacterized protein n=1 Tax=Bacillus cereus TaxID=1396 RepID=A0AAN6B552_BACCE|nr:hypothetical protein [Bacillus cereus]KAB2446081.1 hypothetical protein F8165_28610 [Bacillus cereus]